MKLLEECMLTDEQRSIILKGIAVGKKDCQTFLSLIPETATKKALPFMLYDFVNTGVKRIVEENPHTQMKVYTRRAGFHPYIVVHDTVRNIYILVLKLHHKNEIFNPSGFRGDFASSNFDRLIDMGVPQEELLSGIENYQFPLPLETGIKPFGIIVCYDSKSDTVYEGALRPDQEDWIYKEDITKYIDISSTNLVPINQSTTEDIIVKLKAPKEDIVVKLKKNTSS